MQFFEVRGAALCGVVLSVASAVLVAAGCARQEHANSPHAGSERVQVSASNLSQSKVRYQAERIDIKGAPAPKVTGETALIKRERGFESHAPLVVPVAVPDSLVIEVMLIESTLKPASSYGIQGAILKQGTTVLTLPEAAFTVERSDNEMNSIRVTFKASGFRQWLSDGEHGSVTVSLLLTDRDNMDPSSLHTIVFEIQTPPSAIASKVYMPFSSYEKERGVLIPDHAKRVSLVTGEQLELVGLIELKSGDSSPVEVEIPSNLPHDLEVVELTKSALTSECSHQMSETVSHARRSSRLMLFPLGSLLMQSIEKASVGAFSSVTLPKKGTVQIGIYSPDPTSLLAPQDALHPQSVPRSCEAQCMRGAEGDWADKGKWGDACVECGNRSGNSGDVCFQCMRQHSPWCRWQDWRIWREFTNVNVGMAYRLEVLPGDRGTSSEFGLAYKNQRVEARGMPILSSIIFLK